jgi:hypothetical protein
MDMKFWKFWTVLVLIVFSLAIGQIYFGLFEFILLNDNTYITFLNLLILAIAHMQLFAMHHGHQYMEVNHKMIRYMGETAVALGLIGTLIGFMIVLWSVFGGGVVIDPSNTAAMTNIITQMSQGMASALITSLSGIGASIIINLQLVFLEE